MDAVGMGNGFASMEDGLSAAHTSDFYRFARCWHTIGNLPFAPYASLGTNDWLMGNRGKRTDFEHQRELPQGAILDLTRCTRQTISLTASSPRST